MDKEIIFYVNGIPIRVEKVDDSILYLYKGASVGSIQLDGDRWKASVYNIGKTSKWNYFKENQLDKAHEYIIKTIYSEVLGTLDEYDMAETRRRKLNEFWNGLVSKNELISGKLVNIKKGKLT